MSSCTFEATWTIRKAYVEREREREQEGERGGGERDRMREKEQAMGDMESRRPLELPPTLAWVSDLRQPPNLFRLITFPLW